MLSSVVYHGAPDEPGFPLPTYDSGCSADQRHIGTTRSPFRTRSWHRSSTDNAVIARSWEDRRLPHGFSFSLQLLRFHRGIGYSVRAIELRNGFRDLDMVVSQLGRLEPADLRSAWADEAGHFTPWLAQEENLALLGQTMGIELELEAQERNVGPFRADILCKDVKTSHWVLIENQLERTDHVHLGQLLTYAAGLDAVAIVWIARNFTEEHRATLDWLNEKTEDSVNFFGLEIELWRIGDSVPAPKFNVISQPNGWTSTIAVTARGLEAVALTPNQELQLSYWEALVASANAHPLLRPQSPRPHPYLYFSAGRAGTEFSARVSSRAPWIQVSVNFPQPQADVAWFPLLSQDRYAIEEEIGRAFAWDDPPDGFKENRIAIRLEGADFRDREDWPRQHQWLLMELEKLYKVFGPRLRNLPPLGSSNLDMVREGE